MVRQTWAEIDLGAINENVRHFKRIIPKGTQIMAVVKANGYGHGAVPVAKEALLAGATWLGVALLEEGIELREAGFTAPICMLGYLPLQHMRTAQKHQISIPVTDLQFLQEVDQHVDPSLPPLRFHLKIDTGMSRLGIQEQDLQRFIDTYLERQKGSLAKTVIWEGVYTHFATADEEVDNPYFKAQVHQFEQIVERINAQGIDIPFVHMANSATIIRLPQCKYTNLVRLGISMYGLYPSPGMKTDFPFPLKQAFSLHSYFSLIKKVPAHMGVSYGITYQTSTEEWIGTIPIGYGDGWQRNLSNQADVLVGGKRMKICGRICMDSTMVRLDRKYTRQEKVTLIGSQHGSEISLDEIAGMLNTINYEVPCIITGRVPRIYVKDGEKIC